MEDKPADEPSKPKEEEDGDKKEKEKEKQHEEEEQEVYSDASDKFEEDEDEEYMDALDEPRALPPKLVDALRSKKSKARKKRKAKLKKQRPKPVYGVPQRIPPVVGMGEWWPSAEEWHLAVVNARWRDEMERLGVPYPTAHMNMAQLDEWRVFFQTMFNCEPWEYHRLRCDSDGLSISDDDDPTLSD